MVTWNMKYEGEIKEVRGNFFLWRKLSEIHDRQTRHPPLHKGKGDLRYAGQESYSRLLDVREPTNVFVRRFLETLQLLDFQRALTAVRRRSGNARSSPTPSHSSPDREGCAPRMGYNLSTPHSMATLKCTRVLQSKRRSGKCVCLTLQHILKDGGCAP